MSPNVQDWLPGLVIAILLVASDVLLMVIGKADTGLQTAVPIIVAFYFGGRVTKEAVREQRRVNGGTDA